MWGRGGVGHVPSSERVVMRVLWMWTMTAGWLELSSSAHLAYKDCVHGLFLNSPGSGRGFCKCLKNWKGPYCAVPTCFNGGYPNVLSAHGSFSCECPPNWLGPHCEKPLCQGGFLVGTECHCLSGYIGTFCEIKCVYGTYINNMCVCDRGFQGPHCENCVAGLTGRGCDTVAPIRSAFLWISVFTALIIFVTIFVILFKFSRKKRRRNTLQDRERERLRICLTNTRFRNREGAFSTGDIHLLDTAVDPLIRVGPPPSYSEISLVSKTLSLPLHNPPVDL